MTIVVVGTGHAGVQFVDSLRSEGYQGRIILVGEEWSLPYQRPQLSKDLMMSRDVGIELLPLRGTEFYANARVERRVGPVTRIDRERRLVELADGSTIGYEHLVLATGARSRRLKIPGEAVEGVRLLRTEADARALHPDLLTARAAVMIGAGFVGMEVAAAATTHGLPVSIVSPRPPLTRAVSAPTSDFFVQALTLRGARFVTGEPQEILRRGERNRIVVLTNGVMVEGDLVIIGVGAEPRVELAESCGLAIENGILVDERLRTSDPAISAVGDCAAFTLAGERGAIRVESVPNATDQARYLARRIMDAEGAGAYRSLPWFWSHQGDERLDIAGLAIPEDDVVVRATGERSFSALRFRNDLLVAVESINSPREHMAARRLFEAGIEITREQAMGDGFDLVAAMRSVIRPARVEG